MKIRIYELNKKEVKEVSKKEFDENSLNSSSIYLFDILTSDREEAAKELESYGVRSSICNMLLSPDEHIRFEYMGDTTYGELAYFSSKVMKAQYVGIVNYKNILFSIHEIYEGILDGFIDSFPSFTERQKNTMNEEFIIYILIHEILSQNGKLILSYREEVEVLALNFDSERDKITPENILDSKAHLSDFSRVLEKLFYTLSFPPSVDLLEQESPYRLYFKELLRTMGYLKISLTQTEQRLNSLSDHFNLILQDKSNKRLNFLTIIQAIFVPLTLLAGIYGMNFTNMPELEYKYGYFFSLGTMAIIAFIFLRYFYKNGWFD